MKNRKTPPLPDATALPPSSPAELAALCRTHALRGIEVIAEILCEGDDESAKVEAARQILDRGYGACAPGDDRYFEDDAIRAEARRHGQTAIAVLREIAHDGDCETVRVAARTAMTDRGIEP